MPGVRSASADEIVKWIYFAAMYTRDESSRTRREFWTAFGKYLAPVPSAEGGKVNWVNYHTGVKDVYFRMEAGNGNASICITIEHPDRDVQAIYFEQFLQLKEVLHSVMQEPWDWRPDVYSDGRLISRICREMTGVSVFNREDWPALISFLKPRIIGLDAFWENARYAFDGL